MPQKDLEKRKQYHQEYYRKNQQQLLEKNKQDYILNINGRRDRHYLKQYNITYDTFVQLKENQNGQCAICGTTACSSGKELCVDHCHTTNKIRGILCMDCNVALGKFKDDINIMKQAIKYLERSNENNCSHS